MDWMNDRLSVLFKVTVELMLPVSVLFKVTVELVLPVLVLFMVTVELLPVLVVFKVTSKSILPVSNYKTKLTANIFNVVRSPGYRETFPLCVEAKVIVFFDALAESGKSR